jgi:hypothetical protein
VVAGSMSNGISYVPVIMALANDSLDRYLKRSPTKVDKIGAL